MSNHSVKEEEVLQVVRKSADGLRIPALVQQLTSDADATQRQELERRSKGVALMLIDRGALIVGDDYKVRLRR